MAGIFISYRRADIDTAFLLQYWLKERFGPTLVFWDKQDIEPGQEWAEVISTRVRSSKAFLAVIGSGWVEERKRLNTPGDWVRFEIESALKEDILIVPVLASNVKNLSAAELPKRMKRLTAKQSLSLSDPVFHSRLMKSLENVVQTQEPVNSESLPVRVGQILLRQLARLQVRAVELVQDGNLDRAMEELREGLSLMMELIPLAPPGLGLDVQLGYLYKTIAQVLDASGHRDEADHYIELAFTTFLQVKDAGIAKGRNWEDIASAINGIGNAYHARNDLEKAIHYYRLALEILPRYAYAWHDLFAACDARARNGGAIDVETMREALAKVIETGANQPGLGNDKIALLRGCLAHWEDVTRLPKKRAKAKVVPPTKQTKKPGSRTTTKSK